MENINFSNERVKMAIDEIKELGLVNSTPLLEVFKGGNANDIYLIDNKHILKIAKQNPKGIEVNNINVESNILESLKNKIDHIPELIHRNIKLEYYLYEFIPGEILKSSFQNISNKEKEQIAKELGNFLYQFHKQKVDFELKSCPDKNYHMKRPRQQEIIGNIKKEYKNLENFINEIDNIIENSLSKNTRMVLTHSDFHWKNIIIEPKSNTLNGIVDFGNVCLDYPEVDFRQMMGRYDIEFGKMMALEYEKLNGTKLDRELLFAHCALNDLWHNYAKKNVNPNPWYDKWFSEKENFVSF